MLGGGGAPSGLGLVRVACSLQLVLSLKRKKVMVVGERAGLQLDSDSRRNIGCKCTGQRSEI